MYAHTRLLGIVAIMALLGFSDPARSAAATTQWVYESPFHLRIPEDPDATKGWMADAIIDVPDHITIQDLDVSVTLTHTSVFDLQLILMSPFNSGIVLNSWGLNDYFEGENYEGTIFDDEAAVSIQDGTAPFTGRFRPVDSLAVFDGQDAYGSWTLGIYDLYYVDTGYLEKFGLTITAEAEPTPTVPEPTATALTLLGLGLIKLSRGRRSQGRPLLGTPG